MPGQGCDIACPDHARLTDPVTTPAEFFLPYEFSPAVLLLCLGALVFYIRGLYRHPQAVGFGRPFAFITGVVLIYLVMQTRYDYWSQHMFFVHRLQHLILHHLGPFLIALAVPGSVLARGTPEPLRRLLAAAWRRPVIRHAYAAVQQPVIAGILFVGLIYLWLIPEIHFYAMLDARLYALMNWSMAIDGLLFWWMIVHGWPGARHSSRPYAWRILLLFVIVLPQIAIGAYIALSGDSLYDIYAVCGRIWPIPALVDQQLGGLITWIPAAMMSLFGMLAVLRQWLHAEKRLHEGMTEDGHALPAA
jgi:putative membrane protein